MTTLSGATLTGRVEEVSDRLDHLRDVAVGSVVGYHARDSTRFWTA